MYHTMNLRTKLIEQLLDDWRIGAGGRENQLTCVDGRTLNGVCKTVLAAIHQFVRYGVVITLGIVFSQILGEDIVAGRGQTIAAHTAVVALLVRSLSR